MELLNPYGLREGKIVYVDDVPKGQACGCLCPKCRGPLIAKKGAERVHHFSHVELGTCQGGFETAIHRMCKEILDKRGAMRLPPVERSFNMNELQPEGFWIDFDRSEIEKSYNGIRPDLICYYKEVPLIIEIYVWHKTPQRKIDEIKALSISALEIDLTIFRRPEQRPDKTLEQTLIEDISNKYWLFNRKAKKLADHRLQKVSPRLELIEEAKPHESVPDYEFNVFSSNYVCCICGQQIEKDGWVTYSTKDGTYVCRDDECVVVWMRRHGAKPKHEEMMSTIYRS